MEILSISLIFFISLCISPSLQSSPYLSPKILFSDYQNMLETFKIFVYNPESNFKFNTESESIFYASLLNSRFVTSNGNEAHLFFVPFAPDLSKRSISRLVKTIRTDLPFWNRTLGADHFYISCTGIGYESDRNLVELKKNSVQISCFPTPDGKFIPHKDITLPPANSSPVNNILSPANKTGRFLGYFINNVETDSTLFNELKTDTDFVTETTSFDAFKASSARYCLFVYGGDTTGIGGALRIGCVPVVITDRPIKDLPFVDLLTWQDIAVFVGSGVGGERLKRLLNRTSGDTDTYERMRNAGVTAGEHFVWNNASPQEYDCFHMVLYQLWLRRHVIRYARREER